MTRPHVRRAARWLIEKQNEDGGWGETCETYEDPSQAGRGPSTASQAAWALLALLATEPAGYVLQARAVERGISYLVERQEEYGQWDEPQFTATSFPSDFYIPTQVPPVPELLASDGSWAVQGGPRDNRQSLVHRQA